MQNGDKYTPLAGVKESNVMLCTDLRVGIKLKREA